MLEITQKGLKSFIQRFAYEQAIEQPEYWIVTKQQIEQGSIIGFTENSGINFINIIAIPHDDFYFIEDFSSYDVTKSLTLYQGDIVNDDIEIIVNGEPVDGYCYVIYCVDPNCSLDCSQLFDTCETLISVDYIGNDMKVGFGGYYPLLKEINLANNLNSLRVAYNELTIVQDDIYVYNGNFTQINITGAFSGTPIKKMVFPDSSTTYTIPANCLAGCTDLEEVVIPNSVTSIGAGAFKGCSRLSYVYIGSGVSTIAEGAFDGCTYPDIYFDVNPSNNYFVGEYGCLLRKLDGYLNQLAFGDVKIHSVVHATKAFVQDNPNDKVGEFGRVNHVVFCKQTTGNTGYYSTTASIVPGMYVKDSGLGGNITRYDTDNQPVTGLTLVTSANMTNVRQRCDSVAGIQIYCPYFSLVHYFENGACIGDKNITKVDFIHNVNNVYYGVWYSLEEIKNNVFKGCTNLTTLVLPTNYNTGYWKLESMITGISAFEGCTALTQLYCNRAIEINSKSFFGCTHLTTILLAYSPYFMPNSSLWFGNTPNLESITLEGTITAPPQYTSAIAYNSSLQPSHAIVNTDTHQIIVGCKNTNIEDIYYTYIIQTIGDNAFYGCSTLVTPIFHHITNIGSSAFYGCTSLANNVDGTSGVMFNAISTIGANAFFGCTALKSFKCNSVTSIGSKAFANSGVENVQINPTIATIPDDVFDGCTIHQFVVSNNNGTVLRSSSASTENSFLKGSTSSVSLVKSGDGKDIVNTAYAPNVNIITEIKSGAFSGVIINAGDTTNNVINIPSRVSTVGSSILAKSILSNQPNGGELNLNGGLTGVNNCMLNTGDSIGLLMFIGAKYFKNLVARTYYNKTHGYTYYEVRRVSNPTGIALTEYCPQTQSTTTLFTLTYDSAGNVIFSMGFGVMPNYTEESTSSHIIECRKVFLLLYANQILTPNEQLVYGDPDLEPGTVQNYLNNWPDSMVPNDVQYGPINYYGPLTGAANAFSDCSWLKTVRSSKTIGTMIGAFKNCTELNVISSNSNSYSPTVDVDIFEGTVPENMFSGSGFAIIGSSGNGRNVVYPIVYSMGAFSGCENIQDTDFGVFGTYGTVFGKESFADTGIENIQLYSPLDIQPDAFKNCTLYRVSAINTCGNYFTVDNNNTICDERARVVVGTLGTDLSMYTGVYEYAFYGRKYTNQVWNVVLNNKTHYDIGESAFNESSVNSYVESGTTSGTAIGKSAFKNCLQLTSVSLNSGVVLSESSFEGCTNLASVSLPASTRVDIPKSCFSKCTSLTSATINGSVADDAFSGCSSITSATFKYDANQTYSINAKAFSGCPINALTISSATETSNYLLNSAAIYLKSNTDNQVELVLGTKSFATPIIPDADMSHDQILKGVRVIGKYAFMGRGLIGEITIPATVTKIDDYAFANNPGITVVNIPPTVEYIGASAFSGCTNLKGITLPDSCKFVGAAAFSGCDFSEGLNCNTMDVRYHSGEDLTAQTLQRTVPSTKAIEYKGSVDLTNSKIFTSIATDAFRGTNIKSVKLPAICTKIHPQAFYDCQNLSELHITSTALELGNACFFNCCNLRDIYIDKVCTITVTSGASNIWKQVGDNQTGPKYLHVKSGQILTNIKDLIDINGFTCVTM